MTGDFHVCRDSNHRRQVSKTPGQDRRVEFQLLFRTVENSVASPLRVRFLATGQGHDE
jgi:hypothetical protein